tara:strand:- start:45 stop:608 length:564 start_codon:yes stop_codon:yes gene_type:complete
MALTKVRTGGITDSHITSAKIGSDYKQGITFYETMRMTANLSAGTGADLSQTFETVDTGPHARLLIGGAGMSASSGIFTFPATGIYLLMTTMRFYADNDISYAAHTIRTSTDNFSSNDVEAAQTFASWGTHNGSHNYESMSLQYIFDCTNTSTHKFKMKYSSVGTVTVSGNTDANETFVTVIRLGDT